MVELLEALIAAELRSAAAGEPQSGRLDRGGRVRSCWRLLLVVVDAQVSRDERAFELLSGVVDGLVKGAAGCVQTSARTSIRTPLSAIATRLTLTAMEAADSVPPSHASNKDGWSTPFLPRMPAGKLAA